MAQYFVIYKPFGILSQFSGDDHNLKSVADFPKEVYPVGRLDKDSEGLLLITDDKQLNHYLLNPVFGHQRTYLAQVEGIPDQVALERLASGVEITVDGKPYHTKKAQANLPDEVNLPDRDPPIRYRKNVPDTWLELSLIEGKNRQVRKMTAAVGYPTLRLVRWSMERLTIEGFEVGKVREYSQHEIYDLLAIDARKLKGEGPFSQKSNNRNKNRR